MYRSGFLSEIYFSVFSVCHWKVEQERSSHLLLHLLSDLHVTHVYTSLGILPEHLAALRSSSIQVSPAAG